MRHTARLRTALAVLVLAPSLVLAACSAEEPAGGSGQETSAESPTEDADPFADDDRTGAEVLHDAVDATLATDSFVIDSDLALEVGPSEFGLSATGPVDYEALVSDVTLSLQQQEQVGEIQLRADGETLWVRAEGDMVPPVPEGRTWVEGSAELLGESDTFDPSGLLGVLLALRAAEDAQIGETSEVDGVPVREITTTVSYAEAVEAAGPDAELFRSALQLTGAAEQADLDIVAVVGADDVVRDFDLQVDAGDVPLEGGYEVHLRGVGEDVTPPEAPPADEVLTGEAAAAYLEAIIQ